MVSSSIYKAIFESFSEASILTDRSGTIVLFNKKAQHLLGLTLKEVEGKQFNLALGIDSSSTAVKSFGNLFKGPTNESVLIAECSIVTSRNLKLSIELSMQSIIADKEEYVYVIIRDVTKDKKKDALLLENRTRLLEAYKISNIGIWEWDMATDAVFWSEEVYRIKGIDPSVPAYPFKEQHVFYTEESWNALYAAVSNTLATGEAYQLEIDYVQKNGSVKNAIVHGGAKKDISGKVIGLYGTVEDITEKKKSELILLENESNLTAIIENTTDGIWAIDKNRNIIYLNEVFKKSFYRDLGVQLEKGMNLREELPENIRESWLKRFDEAFENVRLEYEDKIKIGDYWIYFDVALNPIVLNGEVVGVSVFARNITERKRIENALRESQAQLAELVNATFEGIVISKNGLIVNTNEQFSKMVGYEQKELIGLPILNFVAKEFHEKVMEELSKKESITYEHFILKKNGELIPVEIHGKSIVSGDNETLRFTAIRNVSERKKAEQALKNSEEKYRNVFENIQDLYFQSDLRGVVLEVSPSIYEILGFTREEAIGTSVLDFYANIEDREAIWQQLFSTGQVKDWEVNFYNKSRDVLALSLNAFLRLDEEGNPICMEGMARDISSRVAIEQEIKKQNRTLQIQNKELEQFTYVTSHDLQEPLRTLTSISDLLKEEFKNGDGDKNKVDKYLEYIVQSANRMQDLVKGLLDFSRIGKEKEISLVDCNHLLSQVLTDLDYSIKENNATIHTGDLPVISGYSVELRFLFQNLISNALKFRRQDVPLVIHVSAQKEKEVYCFSIKDNGIGIAERDKDKIFIIFKRLHNRSDYAGTGIGLSHCKKIVELHGGTIWVDSILEEGSIFKFSIPII